MPAAVTGHRLVRFERRSGPRSNTGDCGATIHAQAKTGETAEPGRPRWRSNGSADWEWTAGTWYPSGHRGGPLPLERDFLVGSVTVTKELRRLRGSLRPRINLNTASDRTGTAP